MKGGETKIEREGDGQRKKRADREDEGKRERGYSQMSTYSNKYQFC